MKKFGTLLFAAVAILAFTATSCRKDRTCVCTDADGNTSEYPLLKQTKAEAETSCSAIEFSDETCTVE